MIGTGVTRGGYLKPDVVISFYDSKMTYEKKIVVIVIIYLLVFLVFAVLALSLKWI